MSFGKKTVRDVKLDGKRVLVSVDFNVPGDEDGNVTNNYRMHSALPTIKYLLKKDCKIILMSHRNRPGGTFVKKDSLQPVAKELETLLKRTVLFASDCIGEEARTTKKNLKKRDILLLENTRFHAGEDANDKDFAKALAEQVDYFVQDAFGNAHRKHASMDAITKFLPSVAGLLLEKEVTTIQDAMQNPKRPLMAIVGGAKISDKIEVIETFIKTADILVVGGAMANTFLLARGIRIGESMAEKGDIDEARELIKKAKTEAAKRHFVFYMPQDAVVADEISKTAKTRIVDWDAHVIASIENYPKKPPHDSDLVKADEKILDIGPFSGAFIAGAMQTANTVVWNGTMGVAEVPGVQGPVGPFAHGTELIIEGMLGEFGHRPYTLIGGGDTAAYVEQRGLVKFFNHVSTGGGASLDLIAGKKLPGVEALANK